MNLCNLNHLSCVIACIRCGLMVVPNQALITLFNENVDPQKTAIVMISSDPVEDYNYPMGSFGAQHYYMDQIDAMKRDILLIDGHVRLAPPADCEVISDISFSKLNGRVYDRISDLFGVAKYKILLVDDNGENRDAAMDADCHAVDPVDLSLVKQAILALQ